MEEPAVAVPGWRKSSHSGQSGAGSCVQAGNIPGTVLVRDTTQHGTGPVLRVTPADWSRFTARVRGTAPSS